MAAHYLDFHEQDRPGEEMSLRCRAGYAFSFYRLEALYVDLLKFRILLF